MMKRPLLTRKRRTILEAGGLALLAALLAHGLATSLLRAQELGLSDLLFRARGPIKDNQAVTLVAIDDASFAENGLQWPWPRDYIARIVDGIAADKPKAIAIDVFFYEASRPNADSALAASIKRAGNVILVNDITTQSQGGFESTTYNRPIPEIDAAVAGLGLTNFPSDADGSVRRLLAFQQFDGEIHYSWSMETARLYLGEESFGTPSANQALIGDRAVELDNQYLTVNFSGPAGSVPQVSAYQVANGLLPKGTFTDKIVILGATSPSLHDEYSTPLGSSPKMSGAEINAQAINTILTGRYLRDLDGAIQLLVTLLVAAAALGLTLRLKPLAALAATAGVIAVYLAISVATFSNAGTTLPLLAPLLAGSVTYLGGTALQLVEAEQKYARSNALVRQIEREKKRSDNMLHVIVPIGVELSKAKDFNRLLEVIMMEAQSFCHADGSTLYLYSEDALSFVAFRNSRLNVAMGGTTGVDITYEPLPLKDASGAENHRFVATHAAITGKTVNIANEAEAEQYSGTREMDEKIGFKSESLLSIPLQDSDEHLLGVLQLLNARDPDTDEVTSFDANLQTLVESLSWMATVALEAYRREQNLKREIQELKIEVDEAKRSKQVSEIVDTEFFTDLKAKAASLRNKPKS